MPTIVYQTNPKTGVKYDEENIPEDFIDKLYCYVTFDDARDYVAGR